MKNILLLFFCFCSFNVAAQKADSIYYLIDTTKTSPYDKMWEIHEEYPSLKVYVMQCPCLQYDQKPSFIYNIPKVNGRIIGKAELKAVKRIDISTLIGKAKKLTSSDFNERDTFFFIEPMDKKYIIHQVRLLKPTKPRSTSVDYENIPHVDSAKLKKH